MCVCVWVGGGGGGGGGTLFSPFVGGLDSSAMYFCIEPGWQLFRQTWLLTKAEGTAEIFG